jgi:molybdate transport system regulatory protein
LAGTVVKVEQASVISTVTVRLTGGQEVVSAITRESALSLDLKVGDAVVAIIRPPR